MTRERRLGPGVVLCAALAGFVVAHALDYVVVYPEPVERAHALARTGHGYLAVLGGLAWPLLGLGLALALAAGATRRRARALPAPAAVAVLAAAQSAFFVTAEIGERVAAHAPLADLVHTSLLAAGLAAQVVVAAMLVALLGALAWLGRRYVLAAPRPLPRAVVATARTPYVSPLRRALVTGLAPARAPPAY